MVLAWYPLDTQFKPSRHSLYHQIRESFGRPLPTRNVFCVRVWGKEEEPGQKGIIQVYNAMDF